MIEQSANCQGESTKNFAKNVISPFCVKQNGSVDVFIAVGNSGASK